MTVKQLVEEVCDECGKTFRRSKGRRKGRCPDCGIAAHAAVAAARHFKSGPLYEEDVRGQLRYWRSEAKRLGIRV